MAGYVYIVASGRKETLYVGVTTDIIRRIYEHKEGIIAGFTRKYGVKQLVYYEIYDDIRDAIDREKKLKKYKREYKMNLIEASNPEWFDLYETLLG